MQYSGNDKDGRKKTQTNTVLLPRSNLPLTSHVLFFYFYKFLLAMKCYLLCLKSTTLWQLFLVICDCLLPRETKAWWIKALQIYQVIETITENSVMPSRLALKAKTCICTALKKTEL